MQIYPSVLALQDNPASWDSRIAELPIEPAGIHYDIGDGDFVPSMMLRPEDVSEIHLDFPIDIHLMVRKPSLYFSTPAFERAQAVAFHIECDEDIHETIQYLKNAGKRVGLAVLDTTPVQNIDQYLLEIDYILVMTVKGGYSGTLFIPEVLSKIVEIHNKNPELPIVVDGGINKKTLPLCVDAGATAAVMSSALFSRANLDWLDECIANKK